MASDNDNFADATILTTPSGTISGLSNVGSTAEPGEYDPSRPGLWFVFHIPMDSPTVTAHFDQGNSPFDGYLYLFKTSELLRPDSFRDWIKLQGSDAATFDISLGSGFYAVKWTGWASSSTTTAGVFNWSGLTYLDAAYQTPSMTFATAALGPGICNQRDFTTPSTGGGGGGSDSGGGGTGGGSASSYPSVGQAFPQGVN